MDTTKFSIVVIAIFAAYVWTALTYAPREPAEMGVRAWDWAEDYCRDYGGLKAFKIVGMEYVTVVCEDHEAATRRLKKRLEKTNAE